ncbi:MAG TPA: helix-turn-helix transcriptional regulator [Flavobacterium sp.]|jgi:DNA-binding Xre family transcriptional regulator|nr:helix-turn-helix transcriptional regulator [Flavobacterium sp.]
MLAFNLQTIFKARQIDKPYSFLVKIGIAPHTATRLLNNNVRVMRLDHIELLCKNLHCEPNDLLQYKNDKNTVLPQNHPLNNLIPQQQDNQWQETLKTIPLKQLKEIASIINQSNTEKE